MTFSPEDDLAVYNKLNEYSDMANDLNEEMTRNEEINIEEKEKIFFPMIDEMKEIAEEMIANYILFLKDKNNRELLNQVQSSIDIILKKIDIFKNKVYEVYKLNKEDYE